MINLISCLYLFSGIALISIGAIATPPFYFGIALGVLGLLSFVFGVFIIKEYRA
tara:strand:+ start:263 stop:424 length:162 start_codon:yes stop_codon:yes gene_type:complete